MAIIDKVTYGAYQKRYILTSQAQRTAINKWRKDAKAQIWALLKCLCVKRYAELQGDLQKSR